MIKKTNADRMIRIRDLCESNLGDVRGVYLKLRGNVWCATLKMTEGGFFEEISVSDLEATEAVKGLKNRLKKIIKRYNTI